MIIFSKHVVFCAFKTTIYIKELDSANVSGNFEYVRGSSVFWVRQTPIGLQYWNPTSWIIHMTADSIESDCGAVEWRLVLWTANYKERAWLSPLMINEMNITDASIEPAQPPSPIYWAECMGNMNLGAHCSNKVWIALP